MRRHASKACNECKQQKVRAEPADVVFSRLELTISRRTVEMQRSGRLSRALRPVQKTWPRL